VFGSKFSHHSDNIGTAVLGQSSGDDFQGVSQGSIRELLLTIDGLSLLIESVGKFHFSGSSSGHQLGGNGQVLGNGKSVLEVSLDLIKDVLGTSSKKDGTGLGVLALQEVGEVLVSDLSYLEKSAFESDIGFLDLVGSVDDLGSGDSGNTLVVGLSDSSDDRDVVFHQVMGGDVTDTFFGDDDVGLPFDDLLAHISYFVHFLLKSIGHVALPGHFHTCLTFSLLVLKRRVQ